MQPKDNLNVMGFVVSTSELAVKMKFEPHVCEPHKMSSGGDLCACYSHNSRRRTTQSGAKKSPHTNLISPLAAR